MSCIPDFTVQAETDEYVHFVMLFGPRWSGPEADGEVIPRSRVSVVDFYIKDSETDEEYILHLSDGNATQIEWLNEDTGEIAVLVGNNATNIMDDPTLKWELKITIATGERLSLGTGECALEASLENGV